jgi:hypothetical protein
LPHLRRSLQRERPVKKRRKKDQYWLLDQYRLLDMIKQQ